MANGIDQQHPPSDQALHTEAEPGKVSIQDSITSQIVDRPSHAPTHPSAAAPSTPQQELQSTTQSKDGNTTSISRATSNEPATPPPLQKLPPKSLQNPSTSASPSPSISTPTHPPTGRHTNMTRDQIKYSGAIMRNLRRHRDANPFLHPVDYVKMNLPDYPKIIQHPMDLGTVEAKLNNLEYENIEDFIADVRLVFSNCFKFNGPEAMISMLCQNVETAFEKSLRQMPSSTDGEPKTTNARPKRDKHPPPSKDYPEPATKRRSNVRQSNAQMRFCGQVLRELRKPKYRDISYPFLQPVDVVALNIPDYLEVIKHPMDLSTMERKLDEGDYQTPDDFERDMRLMFQNCYTYNPPGSPVHEMGKRLESEFDKKWSEMPEPVPPEVQSPPPAPPAPQPKRRRTKSDVFEEQEHSEDETRDEDDPIAVMERHIANMSRQLESLRSSKKKKQAKPPQVQPRKPAPKRRRPPAKPPVEEYPDFTLEQKQLLSERINNLTDDRLHHVVGIIQKSMPDLGGDEQEIELDMDNLDKRTLHKLHEYVMGTSLVRRPSTKKAKPAPKRAKTETKPVEKFQDKSSSESDTGSSSSGSSDDSSSSSSDEM